MWVLWRHWVNLCMFRADVTLFDCAFWALVFLRWGYGFDWFNPIVLIFFPRKHKWNSFPRETKISTQSMVWLVMAGWHKEPRHQQEWHWPILPGIFSSQHQKGRVHKSMRTWMICQALMVWICMGCNTKLGLATLYQCRNSHYKDRIVSWPSYIYNGNHYTSKGDLYIKPGPLVAVS